MRAAVSRQDVTAALFTAVGLPKSDMFMYLLTQVESPDQINSKNEVSYTLRIQSIAAVPARTTHLQAELSLLDAILHSGSDVAVGHTVKLADALIAAGFNLMEWV